MVVKSPLFGWLNDYIARLKETTAASAADLSDKINTELQTHAHDTVGDMSMDELYGLVNEAASDNLQKGQNPTPPDRGVVVKAVTADLVQKTASAIAAKYPQKSADAIQASIEQNLASGTHGNFETQHINDSIEDIVKSAQAGDPSMPALDPATQTNIVGEVTADVRQSFATTLANELMPASAGRIKGGYPTTQG